MVAVRWLQDYDFFERRFIETWLFGGESSGDRSTDEATEKVICVSGYERRLPETVLTSQGSLDGQAVLLLSDETLSHSFRPYKRARIIFRNYFQPRWMSRRVFTLPLGWNPGFADLKLDHNRRSSRKYSWAFVGQIKGSRGDVLEEFSGVKPAFTYASQTFNDELGLDASGIAKAYSQAHFVLCPFGNRSPESFRVMEALACGAIPVTVAFRGLDWCRLVYGEHPFIVGKDWQQARREVASLLDSPSRLAALHNEVSNWFDAFGETLQGDIIAILRGAARSELKSPQFRFQRRAIFDPRVQAAHFLHYSKRGKKLQSYLRFVLDHAYRTVNQLRDRFRSRNPFL